MRRTHRSHPAIDGGEGLARATHLWTICLWILLGAGCAEPVEQEVSLYRAPAISNQVGGVVFEAGNWEPHLAAGEAGVSWGNHRAVVVVDPNDQAAEAVAVVIPWRRRDRDPGAKAIVVADADSGEPVRNAVALRVENASGDIAFQPNPGSATYHVYYLPWQSTGGYYPSITYPTQTQMAGSGVGLAGPEGSPSRADSELETAPSWTGKVTVNDPAWEARIRSSSLAELPRARATHIQSVNEFHSFFPMEVIATPEEEAGFMAAAEGGWRVVVEHREYPVRMSRFIPQHWVHAELPGTDFVPDSAGSGSGENTSAEPTGLQNQPSRPTPAFTSRVFRGEAFTLQLALIPGKEPLDEVQVTFLNFPESLAGSMTCFNCNGIDERGDYFRNALSVPAGTVQPLWLGIEVPEDHPAGPMEGWVTVTTAHRGSKTIHVTLDVSEGQAENGGANEPELMTRLAWLNSTSGTNPDFIIQPFHPVAVRGHTLEILGRSIELGESGLPRQILSFFNPELTHFNEDPEPILAGPLELQVVVNGQPERFEPIGYEVQQDSRGVARWTSRGMSYHFRIAVEGRLEYDGMLDYRVSLTAEVDVDVDEIALPISLAPDAAEYMLGLGRKGGKRPDAVDWKWAVENHQEGVWLGGIHKGLQYVLRDENYIRPLNTNFYRNQPLQMPPSWYNQGRGGIRISEEDGSVTALNYSGPRTVRAGDTLHFNVRFLITPFKPIDTRTHFDTRFVHMYVPVDSVRAWGGTVVNIHHANEINPYINYPFFNLGQQAAYIDEAHAKGIKVKLYNTIRELTYKAHELFALRSLGDEILNDGEGGGHSWMQEHLEDHYHSAWHAWRVDDAAMLNKGTSRWTNYYIEGLSWLAENQHIDGLYLDDIAFSRETVKRLVSVLNRHRDEVVIDLHSANQFNVRDGYINSAMLYMEHFPYISRLWFGEYFEYDLDEDYWLTEVSGLPFGLMGEMLQDGGHPYRGLLYGMTARMYGNVDPRPVWQMMNRFGIADSRMLGYWLEDTPVTTDHPRVLATTFSRPEGSLIVLASWSDKDEVVALDVNWEALGLGVAPESDGAGDEGEAAAGSTPIAQGATVRALAPGVDGLQEEHAVDLSAVEVPAGMGLFILLGDSERQR
jgi:hypothetical protein